MKTKHQPLSTLLSTTDNSHAQLKYLHSRQEGSMGFPGPSACQNDRLHCSRCIAKQLRMFSGTKHMWYHYRRFREWHVMERFGLKRWYWGSGCKGNLYMCKSIIRVLEKWPWQTMCINEGLCNTVFRILLIFYKCPISISRSEEHLSWMMWSFLTTGHLIQLPGGQ